MPRENGAATARAFLRTRREVMNNPVKIKQLEIILSSACKGRNEARTAGNDSLADLYDGAASVYRSEIQRLKSK